MKWAYNSIRIVSTVKIIKYKNICMDNISVTLEASNVLLECSGHNKLSR